jgi:Flp pilus assembly pilin Flp
MPGAGGPSFVDIPTARPWSLEERRSHPMPQLLALIPSIRDDDGQGLAEYALILTLIALVAIIALIFLGTQVSTILDTVGKSV